MSDTQTTVETFAKLPPLCLSYADFMRVVQPIIGADRYANDTARDLWQSGAPNPMRLHERFVYPGRLANWLADVLTRQGRPLDVIARAYVEMQGR